MSGTHYIGLIGWTPHMGSVVSQLHLQSRNIEVLSMAVTSPEAFTYGRDVLSLKHLYRDPAQLYTLHQLDTIIVCSSAEYHLEHVTKALQSGTNVIIDFPLASNVEDCLALEQIVRRYPSQQVLLCLPRRFDANLQRLQQVVADGLLGDIISVTIENHEALPADFFEQTSSASVSKGIFMDLTIQDIDMVSWLTGQSFDSVYAKGTAKKFPALLASNDADTAQILATLDRGATVSLLSSRTGCRPDGYSLSITGTAGELSYESAQSQIVASTAMLREAVTVAEPYEVKLYQSALKYYLTETLRGTKLPYTVQVGTAATQAAVAMTKSFVLGEITKLP